MLLWLLICLIQLIKLNKKVKINLCKTQNVQLRFIISLSTSAIKGINLLNLTKKANTTNLSKPLQQIKCAVNDVNILVKKFFYGSKSA